MVVLVQVFQKVRYSVLKSWLNKLNTMSYYAVAKGRSIGVFMTWGECEAQVKGFSGAKYKKFGTEESAKEFIASFAGPSCSNASITKTGYTNYANASNSNMKRTYSTSSSNYQRGGKSSKSYPSKSNSRYQDDSDSDSKESDEGLETILNKQMDDIEKRLKSFGKGIDKIINGSKTSDRKTILIEPQAKRSRKSTNEFEVDNEGYVQVYTDGACSANGQKGARAGLGVYWGEEHPLNISEPVSGRATNNCGEIQAATRAIQQALKNNINKLVINTDSKFVINSVTKWMPGWKRKGWKLASGAPVKNETDFKELDGVLKKLALKWNYVEAHRGIHGNERADELAKAGAAMYNRR